MTALANGAPLDGKKEVTGKAPPLAESEIEIKKKLTDSIPIKTRVMMVCVQSLCYFHCSAQSGVYLVIPYYVQSTPHHGWEGYHLSVIFALFNIGGLLVA